MTRDEAIAQLTDKDWEVIYLMTLDASDSIRAKDIQRIRDFPPTIIDGRRYGQPYGTWCKVHRIITARKESDESVDIG